MCNTTLGSGRLLSNLFVPSLTCNWVDVFSENRIDYVTGSTCFLKIGLIMLGSLKIDTQTQIL